MPSPSSGVQSTYPPQSRERLRPTSAHQLGRRKVSLVIADLKEATVVIVQNHYLHRGRTMAQLPYWIQINERRAGVILFAYPRLSVRFHGYAPMELLELARLWISPEFQGLWVRDRDGKRHASSVASCAIGMALRRIGHDWRERYKNLPAPRAIVSWADLTRHEGTVYRAANFAELGVSGGKGHKCGPRATGGQYKDHLDYQSVKRAFLYRLG